MRAESVTLALCVFMSVTYQGALSVEENKSGESIELGLEVKGTNDTSAEGPPDSHEAMNNRELKPKLTIGDRKKRSYQFLMGLVKRNNSSYEITSDEKTATDSAPSADEAKASELLLELMVKIAENPEQWSKVHDLLQKIDKDLMKSKQIIENMKSSMSRPDGYETSSTETSANRPQDAVKWVRIENSTEDIHRLDMNHDRNKKNTTATAPGQWQQPEATRVTGNPLVHTNFNKNPKAYIAVSVIAPKPMRTGSEEEDLTLENELKELKPWSHQQNLKNMAQIRSRWVIQSNEEKPLYSP